MARVPSERYAEGVVDRLQLKRLEGKTTREEELKSKDRRSVYDVPWTFVFSSWVKAIRFFSKTKQLQIWFKDRKGRTTAIIQYKVGPELYRNLLRAISKGKFVWKHLYHVIYQLILVNKKYRIIRLHMGYGKGRGLDPKGGPYVERYLTWLRKQIKNSSSPSYKQKLRRRGNMKIYHTK